ncbi:myosin-10-like [Impatiens glandulifera]|uniref:myosin-10-like n=1 Tax=Impatiens glandulifera TaxID=253017 RepID=UPI001FB15B21|nr:myosin-10-like [Impatiens glandulifera]
MKKLFFFRSTSSSSSGANNDSVPQESKDDQTFWGNNSKFKTNDQSNENSRDNHQSPRRSLSKSRKHVSEEQSSHLSPCLRRSFSFSSAAFNEADSLQRNAHGFIEQTGSHSSKHASSKQSNRRSSHGRALTPQSQSRSKFHEAVLHNGSSSKLSDSSYSSRGQCDSSESSYSSKVLDRYIDGEQQYDITTPRSNSPMRNQFDGQKSGLGKRPPRVQHTAPTSPIIHSTKEKPSSRYSKGNQIYYSSKDWAENGFGKESPRTLAKNVIERLSQSQSLQKPCLQDYSPDFPITLDDIYGGSHKRSESFTAAEFCGNSQMNESDAIPNSCDQYGDVGYAEAEEDLDCELQRKSKEAKERVLLLSEELEQQSFLDQGFTVPALVQMIRDLAEERIGMAAELSASLHDRISDRASAREELQLVRIELDMRTRKLEKEKSEIQLSLEKELDRRSNDWSFKLEKCQSEEHRLRERVRELAEQNVSLQREITCSSEREIDGRNRVAHTDVQLKDLTERLEGLNDENHSLHCNILDMQEKHKAKEEDRDLFKRNYEEKDKECKDLYRSVSRLQRTCNELEKTVDGLREGLSEELSQNSSVRNVDKNTRKLQMEHVRLAGVEQALRKEIESYKMEVNSLRHENISLLERLSGSGKGVLLTFKLDQELLNCISSIQNQGLSLLYDMINACTKLLDCVKSKATDTKIGFNDEFLIEYNTKVQGFKRGIQSLARNLQTTKAVIDEKSNLGGIVESRSCKSEEGPIHDQSTTEDDTIKSELKAETLLTKLLREKLLSKEVEVEQLQADVAVGVRCNDVLRSEVQTALDGLSCASHRMKDLELKIIQKEENVNGLQNDLQECKKELNILRGILPKVSDERDAMWDEVKKYSEKNMLLNSEINKLKKMVEGLDEDILVKEGQITILKDSLAAKPFDLLSSSDSIHDFQLQ